MSETVGYRYSRDELAALMLLLSSGPLPGAAPFPIDEAQYHAAVAGLAAAGIVNLSGDRALLDRIPTLLIKSMARADRWLRIRSKERDTLLYRAPGLCILAELPARGMCTLTPVETPALCESPLRDAFARHTGPMTFAADAGEATAPETPEEAAEELNRRFEAFCAV